MNSVEYLGFAGGALGIAIGIPQARQVLRLGHGKGISLAAWIFMYLMFCSWGFYGIRIDSISTIISNFVTLIVLASVLIVLIGNIYKALFFLMFLTLLDGFFILELPDFFVSLVLVASVFSQAPQVIKSYRNSYLLHDSAVSIRALQISVTSVSLWAIYATIQKIWLMLFTSFISISMSSLVLFFENKRATKITKTLLENGMQP